MLLTNEVLAVDFDGTVVTGGFPDITKAEPVEHAVEVLKSLVEAGYKITLWTCRENHPTDTSKQFLTDAKLWLEERGIKLYSANETPVSDDFREPTGLRRKAYADWYIDDRNVGGFPGWLAIKEFLLGDRLQDSREVLDITKEDWR